MMHNGPVMSSRAAYSPLTPADFADAFPASRKVYVDGPAGVRVPMREIVLSNGDTLRVYDSSGPQSADLRAGIAKVRAAWTTPRQPSSGSGQASACVTQLHYARRGEITPEMEFIAIREGFDP